MARQDSLEQICNVTTQVTSKVSASFEPAKLKFAISFMTGRGRLSRSGGVRQHAMLDGGGGRELVAVYRYASR